MNKSINFFIFILITQLYSIESRNIESFIVQGNESLPFSYPFMCSLRLKFELPALNDHMCGSSLITENWLITAAHCFLFPVTRLGFNEVWCGTWDFSVDEESRQVRDVDLVKAHEKFGIGESIENFAYDIALVKYVIYYTCVIILILKSILVSS